MSGAAPSGGVRVNRYLAGRGLASRRGADRLVLEGRVAVNGSAAVPGAIVDPGRDRVTVDGRPVPPPQPRRTIVLNKPPGIVSTRHDPQGRPTVVDLVEGGAALFPVGRLDASSRGLILLTSDGDLALRLTHPRHGILKHYLVALRGRASTRLLRGLVAGVLLTDGFAAAVGARVVERPRAGDVLEVVMAEGRRREVRRLVAALGGAVADLQRVGLGPLRLGRLREGASRSLTGAEERALYEAVGLAPPPRRRRS